MLANKHHLLQVLQQHIGMGNGATAETLCRKIRALPNGPITCSTRHLRKLVHDLRVTEGQHIGAHPSRGYFIASTPEELEVCCEFLRARAMTSLKDIAAMRRMSLPELMGQLRFTE